MVRKSNITAVGQESNTDITSGEDQGEQRNVLLTALKKVTQEQLPDSPLDESDGASSIYYTLNQEQIAALVNGNMDTIQSWVSNLDINHAAWLFRWLSQEEC